MYSKCLHFSESISGSAVSTSAGVTLEGLRPAANYSILVSASTAAGEGPVQDRGPLFCATRVDGQFQSWAIGLQ